MREVLYRAKPLKLDVFSPDDQKRFTWVYGSPLINRCRGLSVQIFEQRDGKLCNWECDPETLGQWTGLTDKNGKKIYEGDILVYAGERHEVVFEQRFNTAYFGIVMDRIETWKFGNSVPVDRMEIVGNIHDNPELLEDSAR